MTPQTQTRARDIRSRLFFPPNGRDSTELEITSDAAHRRNMLEAVRKAAEAKFRERWIQAVTDALELRRENIEKFRDFRQRKVTIEWIMRETCRHFNISLMHMISARRSLREVRPRQVVMYLAREYTGLSLPQIANRLERKDHTSVLWGDRQIKKLMNEGDQKIIEAVAAVKQRMGVE